MFRNSEFYFLTLLPLSLIGFWKSYFSKLFTDIDSYIHFHAITMLLWICLLITQAFLIRFKKYSIHKIIGRFSYLLVPAIIISLILLAHSQINIYNNEIPSNRLYILFLQLSLLAIFVTAYIFAIINKNSPAYHVRFMICTALTLIDPAVARIPLNLPPLPFNYQILTFGLTDIILIILIIFESKQNIARIVFPSMLSLFIFMQWLNLTWTESTSWNAFSLWFARLLIS